MAILEPVSNAGLARELEEVVALSSHDGVVLLDDDPGIGAAGGDVLDEAARAETPLALANVMPSLVRILIKFDSNSAIIPRTLSSSRPTGSVDSWNAPPMFAPPNLVGLERRTALAA